MIRSEAFGRDGAKGWRTAAGLGELELSLLYQLLQTPLPARKAARDPRCIGHTISELSMVIATVMRDDSAQH